jgi:soluble lytic murein transglycosylase
MKLKLKNILKETHVLFATALFVSTLFAITGNLAHAASSKGEDSEIISLFKANSYQEVIEVAGNTERLSAWEKILLAKSYERLGYYNRANRVLKNLYNQNPDLRYFIAYFIAYNYEELNDNTNALKWYGLILYSQIERSEIEKYMILINSFERIVAIRENDPQAMPYCVRILKSSLNHHPEASYYLGLLSDKEGDRRKASAYYLAALNKGGEINKKKALERIVEDNELIKNLNEIGLSTEKLVEMLKDEEIYKGALDVSYLLPDSASSLKLRALCYFEMNDYSTALGIYQNYYEAYKDPEALPKISLCYYMKGMQDRSYAYLNKYIDIKEPQEDPGIDVMYFRLELERSKLDTMEYIEKAESIIVRYSVHRKIDRIIEDTFYFAVENGDEDLGIGFLKNNFRFIQSAQFKAWALYILGIYENTDYLNRLIDYIPGSYYYFSAASRLHVDGNLVREADRYYNQGRVEKALGLYIQLYSSGFQKEYVGSRIIRIIRDQEPYRSFYQIADMEKEKSSSLLFDFLRMGLYEELKEIIIASYDTIEPENRMILNYILSKVYYKTGNVYSGITYAEKMLNGYEVNNFLFLPKEVLLLLYPYAYIDIIDKTLSESSNNLDAFFVLALIREESRYNRRAKSSKGAIGLMQLLPQTASWIAKRDLTEEELIDPLENIRIGVRYLEYLLSRFSSLQAVLAAYNGGPNNVAKWLTKRPNSPPDKFIEEIPFPETRLFVKKVIRSYNMYMEIYGEVSSP